jgi:hypothetical protein
MSRVSGGASISSTLLAELVAGFTDPGSLALNLIPVAGWARFGKRAAKAAGKAADAAAAVSRGRRIASVAGKGLVEGAALTAIAEVPTYLANTQAQLDYDLYDSLMAVGAGAGLTSLAGGVAGNMQFSQIRRLKDEFDQALKLRDELAVMNDPLIPSVEKKIIVRPPEHPFVHPRERQFKSYSPEQREAIYKVIKTQDITYRKLDSELIDANVDIEASGRPGSLTLSRPYIESTPDGFRVRNLMPDGSQHGDNSILDSIVSGATNADEAARLLNEAAPIIRELHEVITGVATRAARRRVDAYFKKRGLDNPVPQSLDNFIKDHKSFKDGGTPTNKRDIDRAYKDLTKAGFLDAEDGLTVRQKANKIQALRDLSEDGMPIHSLNDRNLVEMIGNANDSLINRATPKRYDFPTQDDALRRFTDAEKTLMKYADYDQEAIDIHRQSLKDTPELDDIGKLELETEAMIENAGDDLSPEIKQKFKQDDAEAEQVVKTFRDLLNCYNGGI